MNIDHERVEQLLDASTRPVDKLKSFERYERVANDEATTADQDTTGYTYQMAYEIFQFCLHQYVNRWKNFPRADHTEEPEPLRRDHKEDVKHRMEQKQVCISMGVAMIHLCYLSMDQSDLDQLLGLLFRFGDEENIRKQSPIFHEKLMERIDQTWDQVNANDVQ